MKRSIKSLISVLLLLCLMIGCLTACGDDSNTPNEPQHVDYVEQTKLDMTTDTLKQEVTVKMHIDGDTTHFYVPKTVSSDGVMKARYLAINTPESTGRIEEWGKTASNFTKEKLLNAVSIIVESDDNSWNFDGNGRFLVWVWYKADENSEYRNLNLELLQNGLALGSSPSQSRYGTAAVAAIAQATTEKLYIFSNDLDPDFPYGEAESVTLKELRTNIASYIGAKVAFEGVITYNSDYTAFIEDYDAETDMYYGIQIFYGYDSTLITPLAQGNRVRVVGVLSSFYGTYQVAGLSYNPFRPSDPANTSKISSGNELPFTETSAEQFTSDVTVVMDDESVTFSYAELAVSTSISMNNLKVTDIYTTGPSASDAGAMTLTCTVDGKTIQVRTGVLKDANGNIVTEQYFDGKTIDIKGFVEFYDADNDGSGVYQIKVYTLDDFIVH